MKKLLFVGAVALLPLAHASGSSDGWTWKYKPLTATTYSIYSGEPGERQAPTKGERKLAIAVKGEAAKEIFDSLYPDAKGVACTDEKGERLRRKGEVWCSYRPSDGYKCFLGFNLRTGESLSGASC